MWRYHWHLAWDKGALTYNTTIGWGWYVVTIGGLMAVWLLLDCSRCWSRSRTAATGSYDEPGKHVILTGPPGTGKVTMPPIEPDHSEDTPIRTTGELRLLLGRMCNDNTPIHVHLGWDIDICGYGLDDDGLTLYLDDDAGVSAVSSDWLKRTHPEHY